MHLPAHPTEKEQNMDNSYAQVVAEFDLDAMRDRLNSACGTGSPLALDELQEIRLFVERCATCRAHITKSFETAVAPDQAGLRSIPGFSEIKALKHGPRLWYITDRTDPTQEPHTTTIGGWHTSYGAACQYAILWYSRAYN